MSTKVGDFVTLKSCDMLSSCCDGRTGIVSAIHHNGFIAVDFSNGHGHNIDRASVRRVKDMPALQRLPRSEKHWGAGKAGKLVYREYIASDNGERYAINRLGPVWTIYGFWSVRNVTYDRWLGEPRTIHEAEALILKDAARSISYLPLDIGAQGVI